MNCKRLLFFIVSFAAVLSTGCSGGDSQDTSTSGTSASGAAAVSGAGGTAGAFVTRVASIISTGTTNQEAVSLSDVSGTVETTNEPVLLR